MVRCPIFRLDERVNTFTIRARIVDRVTDTKRITTKYIHVYYTCTCIRSVPYSSHAQIHQLKHKVFRHLRRPRIQLQYH